MPPLFARGGQGSRSNTIIKRRLRYEHRRKKSRFLQVKIEEDTVWLTQAQMVELFGSSKANISEHITNIYQQGELVQSATVRKFRTVRKEGNRMVTRNMDYYNLDMIISVGFRVNSNQGIRFRQWANNVLKEYLLRGYVYISRCYKWSNVLTANLCCSMMRCNE